MTNRFILFFIALTCAGVCGEPQTMRKELSDIAEDMAKNIAKKGMKRVAVVDFTPMHGDIGDLGKYIADRLTISLVTGGDRAFSVLDRANLNRILEEHKLTAQGLIDPENAKQLGKFAGVDTLVLGTLLPLRQNVELTARAITTETADIVTAAETIFKIDETVRELLASTTDSHGAAENKTPNTTKSQLSSKPGGSKEKGPQHVSKSFGDLNIEIDPPRIVNNGQLLTTMVFSNRNPRRSIWVALNTDLGSNVRGALTDSNGTEFPCEVRSVSGIENAAYQHGGFFQATEIQANGSISATMKFVSRIGVRPTPGQYRLQLELLLGNTFDGNFAPATVQNLVSNVETN